MWSGCITIRRRRRVVLCLDEKSQIQALDRSQPVLPMMPGMLQRRTYDYARNGITSLFANRVLMPLPEPSDHRVIGHLQPADDPHCDICSAQPFDLLPDQDNPSTWGSRPPHVATEGVADAVLWGCGRPLSSYRAAGWERAASANAVPVRSQTGRAGARTPPADWRSVTVAGRGPAPFPGGGRRKPREGFPREGPAVRRGRGRRQSWLAGSGCGCVR
jgi:hypothetical protein